MSFMFDVTKWFKGLVTDSDKTKHPSSFTFETNPFTELSILNGHKDTIKNLLLLDENRIISSSDDHDIILWETVHGQIIKTFSGHKGSVRTILILDKEFMATGSVDKTIKIWNFMDGSCIKTLTEHKHTIFCLAKINSKIFCSGGSDELCFWTFEGDLLKKIKREGEENLIGFLSLPNNRLLVASNDTKLFVYDSKNFIFLNITLIEHVSPIQIIKKINEEMFLTGSSDGKLVIWNSQTLKKISTVELKQEDWKYTTGKEIPLRMKNIIIVKSFLIIGVNYGFIVINFETGETIFKKKQAHQGMINDLITLHNEDVLVTCSDDSSIMFWNLLDTKSNEPMMIGQVEFHKSCVSKLSKISEFCFCSTSTTEKFILLWKDTRMESLKRSFYSNKYSLMAPKYKEYKSDSMTELSAITDDAFDDDNILM
eukprot:gene2691-3887_t